MPRVTLKLATAMARVNRDLAKRDMQDCALVQSRLDSEAYKTFGRFYFVDENGDVSRTQIKLDEYLAENGLIKKFEVLENVQY
jgi:hypothetical protein